MATLNATTVDGNLTVNGNITADNFNAKGILGYRHSGLSIYATDDITDYSTSYNYFPGLGNASAEATARTGRGNLSKLCKAIDYGDRTASYVNGIKIGANINFVYVSGQLRFKNNVSAARGVGLYVIRERDGSRVTVASAYGTCAASGALTLSASGTIVVQEGDFIFISGYKGTAAADIDVIGGLCSQLSIITC